MGIFRRIKTLTMAEINGLLDGIENPIAMLNEYSREMELEIEKGQKALARQIFVEKKHETLISETKALVEKEHARQSLLLSRVKRQWLNWLSKKNLLMKSN